MHDEDLSKATRLLNLSISEVSGVDRPANAEQADGATGFIVTKSAGDTLDREMATTTMLLNLVRNGGVECDETTKKGLVQKATALLAESEARKARRRHEMRDGRGRYRRTHDGDVIDHKPEGGLPTRHSGAIHPDLKRALTGNPLAR